MNADQKAEARRLLELAEMATPGPWKWWTSNSWKRLKRDDFGILEPVIEPYVCPDGHPDCTVAQGDMLFIEAAPDFAALLRLALSRIDELERTLNECITDSPYAQTVGAANRVAQINEIACRPLKEYDTP